MARACDALHRRDRYHSHFYGTSWGFCLKYLQQVPRRSPQRRLRRFLPPVKGSGYLRDTGGAFGIGLTRRHVRDRTSTVAELDAFPARPGYAISHRATIMTGA